jgi:cholera toxin transcriptional activator
MPEPPACRVFRFGVFEVHEALGELRKGGVRIKLNSQPFQVLLLLLEKPSELVTRDEMRRRLWGQDTFVDFDHGLNTAVNRIRDALNDSASVPRFVETIPGKGYRFIAPVSSPTVENPVETSAPVTTADELPAASPALVRTLLLLVQAMYLAFYVGALANLQEIHDIFLETSLPAPGVVIAALITTAAVLIPVRLFIFTAAAFDFGKLPSKFRKLFPVVLILDLLWALSPFLLIHHVNTGLALGMSAALVYLPFAQRSLILMYARGRA